MAYGQKFDNSTHIYNSTTFHACIKYIYFKKLHFNCQPLDFGGHFEKWPPFSPQGAARVYPYPILVSRLICIAPPNFMLLLKNARFSQYGGLSSSTIAAFSHLRVPLLDYIRCDESIYIV